MALSILLSYFPSHVTHRQTHTHVLLNSLSKISKTFLILCCVYRDTIYHSTIPPWLTSSIKETNEQADIVNDGDTRRIQSGPNKTLDVKHLKGNAFSNTLLTTADAHEVWEK